MRYVKLIARADEYDASPGLAVAGTPHDFDGFAADRDGILVAHDLLEHCNGVASIGPVWDELEALGGIWHVRGRWGDMLQHQPGIHSAAVNIASDVSRMFREPQDDYVPPAHRITRTRRIDDEDVIDEIIEIARKSIIDELKHEEGIAASAKAAPRREAYLAEVRHRFRIGYRKAVRRHGYSPAAYDQFRAIRDAVATAAKWIDFEGQEFRLAYGDGAATIREVAAPDY